MRGCLTISCFLLVAICSARQLIGNDSVSFDENTARRFLYYSYAAYQTTELDPWTCSYCTAYGPSSSFVTLSTFHDKATDAFGYIGVNPDYEEIVIVFRGSASLQNWIENLKIYKAHTPFGGGSGSVATGFYQFYMALQMAVTSGLHTLANQNPNYRIWVTGHSLGAAAAALCATDLMVNQGYTSVNTLTFGEPRVGDSTFAEFQNSVMGSITRVTHNADIVVHLPPELFDFEHETTEIWENANDDYITCSGGEDPNCADSVSIFSFSVQDHLSYMDVHCCDGPDMPITLPEDCHHPSLNLTKSF